MSELFSREETEGGAAFSPCLAYRYSLWRHWDWQGHANCVMFIGLNPSTADEKNNDPTIRRCIRFARDWGYGGLYMMNLFGFRATKPADMRAAADAIGPGNDEALRYYASRAGHIVAAWGVLKRREAKRAADVLAILNPRPVQCLAVTKAGFPQHPLFVKAATRMKAYPMSSPL